MPVDPQLEELLRQFAASGQPPLNELPVEEARQLALLLATFDGDPEPVQTVLDRAVPGPGGDIPIRVYRPAAEDGPLPAVAWFHAGGGVVGDLETVDRSCRKLANRTGAVVVSVDYRRAPEHRFPAAVDDCWAVTQWLSHHAGEVGADAGRLAVGGDSMGATFAAVVAQRAARGNGPDLRHQLLVYPLTDLTLTNPCVDRYADGYLLTKDLCIWFAENYLGPEGDPKDPSASPLHAADLRGCAPTTLITAEFDPVRDEALDYAERLMDADVPVTVHQYDGMTHVFFAFGGVLDRARDAMDQAAAALRAALGDATVG